MLCPKCQESMEKGRLEIHGSVSGALMIGFSLQDLYWYDQARSKKSRRRMLNSGDVREAYACKPCGTAAFDVTTPSGSQHRRLKKRARWRNAKSKVFG